MNSFLVCCFGILFRLIFFRHLAMILFKYFYIVLSLQVYATTLALAVECVSNGCTLASLGCEVGKDVYRQNRIYIECLKLNITGPVHILDYPSDVRSIMIRDNAITSFSTTEFDSLVNLTSLNLGNNKISTISPDQFKHNTLLNYVSVGNNNLSSISPDQFKYNTLLTNLQLDYNKIDTISPEAFKYNTLLDFLSLSNNRLTKIAPDLFQNQTKLSTLYLQNNFITSLSVKQFYHNKRLYRLDLSRQTKKLDYTYNYTSNRFNLGTCSIGPSISDCSGITKLDPTQFIFNKQLGILRLNDNSIESFHVGQFVNNTQLQSLDLSASMLNNSYNREFLRNFQCNSNHRVCYHYPSYYEKNYIKPRILQAGIFHKQFVLMDLLDLSNNHIGTINAATFSLNEEELADDPGYKSFSRYSYLSKYAEATLNLENNVLEELEEMLFKNVCIKKLNLKNVMKKNGLYSWVESSNVIPENFFRKNLCLTSLDISDNEFSVVSRNAFKYNTLLLDLTLAYSKILYSWQPPTIFGAGDMLNYDLECPALCDDFSRHCEIQSLFYRTRTILIDTHYYACDKCTRPPNVPIPLAFTCWSKDRKDVFSHHPPLICPQGSWCDTTTLSQFACPKGTSSISFFSSTTVITVLTHFNVLLNFIQVHTIH